MHIHEFQDMMRRLYFHRDSARGIKGTYDWLIDEIRELKEAIRTGSKKDMEMEFADVIAWLASLANITNIDLEGAALKKYPDRCPKCGYSVCRCTF